MISEKHFRLKRNGNPYCDCYCRHPELIENYDLAIADKNETWICHHRMEEVFSLEELVKAGWYFDRKPSELIFIRESEHNGNPKIHIDVKRRVDAQKGRKLSEEHKKKISNGNKGKKLGPTPEDRRKKLSDSAKHYWARVRGNV